jgi:hypothetical protein
MDRMRLLHRIHAATQAFHSQHQRLPASVTQPGDADEMLAAVRRAHAAAST